MKIKAKLASLAAVAIIVGTQYPIASNADQPVLQGGDYIVVFDNQANEQAEAAKLRGQGANITYTYSAVFKGLAGTFNTAQLAALQKNPNVRLISRDTDVNASTIYAETAASWGIDRVDQESGTDTFYKYAPTGAGVDVFVIDTGIASKNSDFKNRLGVGYSAVGGGTEDCNGHGTHVAGTIGGAKFGLAKAVTLYPVRVLGCNGSGKTSGVISGINWVATKQDTSNIKKMVANLSLGGPQNDALDFAVQNLFAKNVIVAVAAGNENTDACTTSPARAVGVITVGASDKFDTRAYFSNWGYCLEVFAPGVEILSDGLKSGSTVKMSGTSMASPHVAGVAALYLSAAAGNTASNFATWIKTNSNSGVFDLNGSPDYLITSKNLLVP